MVGDAELDILYKFGIHRASSTHTESTIGHVVGNFSSGLLNLSYAVRTAPSSRIQPVSGNEQVVTYACQSETLEMRCGVRTRRPSCDESKQQTMK